MHTTKLIAHKGDNRIPIIFKKRQELILRFKNLDGAKWSTTCHSLTPHTFWKAEQTCVLSGNHWDTIAVKPPKFTHMSAQRVTDYQKSI